MSKEIPQIPFSEEQALRIEIMNFNELRGKLTLADDHDPYSVHKIEFYLILVVTKNTYTHFVDFKSYKLKKGSAIFIAKNQVQKFSNEIANADGYAIIFTSLFTNKFYYLSDHLKLNRLFNYHIETPIIHQNQLGLDSFIGVAEKLYGEYHYTNTFAKPEMLSALLHVLLLKAERAKEAQSVQGVKAHWLATFTDFKILLETKYVKSRNSSFYASELNISYKFLNDIVKKLTGKTVKGFIDEFVTIEIKRYLVSTPLSVKEISYKTGFDEPANMVKFFKKNTKSTPLKFRQSN